MQSAKETVTPVFTKVNSAAKQQYSKALENERVHHSCIPIALKQADANCHALASTSQEPEPFVNAEHTTLLLINWLQVAAAAASVGGGLAAVKGSLGSWGTYFKGQAENVTGRTGSPGLSGRGTSQTAASSSPATAAAQG